MVMRAFTGALLRLRYDCGKRTQVYADNGAYVRPFTSQHVVLPVYRFTR